MEAPTWCLAILWLSFVSQLAVAASSTDRCVWYGVCATVNGKGKNCPYNGQPKVLSEQPEGVNALDILRKQCPWMYDGEATRTCCNHDQLQILASGMQRLGGIFQSCPSCVYNFRRLICAYTCASNQTSFMQVLNTTLYNNKTRGIAEVNVAFAEKSLQMTYDSCSNVAFNGAYSINLVCESLKKGEKCPEKTFWHEFGYSSSSPFMLNLTSNPRNPKGIQLLDTGAIACTQRAPGQLYSCPCQTCPARTDCQRKPTHHKSPEKRFVVSIDGVAFVMGALFICFIFAFAIFLSCTSLSTRSLPESVQFETATDGVFIFNWIEGIGNRLRKLIDVVLNRWCLFCATNPIKVLIFSFIVAVILCSGIATFEVITDPVKLWSSPTSVLREQKDFFDENFSPFYRTQQIIITLDDDVPALFNRFDEGGGADMEPCGDGQVTNYTISQLFRRAILEKVLDLQDELEAITVEVGSRNITLEDICFAPLSPDNTKCATESVLQYWQNNVTRLQANTMDFLGSCIETSYIDHLIECTRNPLQPVSHHDDLDLPCLGDYGGPAFPNVVLGGYEGVSYADATALVLTYLINNNVDESENAPAEAWEEAFLHTVESFNRTVSFYTQKMCAQFPTCDNESSTVTTKLRFAYSAQRSIPDEVARESKSDILVIALSYTFMFAYVAVSLGRISFSNPAILLIESKISLALAGVLMVLVAVAASVGSFAYIGVEATLIVFEVVPFLVLAVGVDNLFLMVQALQRTALNSEPDISAHVGRVIASVAPSLTLSALAESIAFFCGALSDIPAVRSFSLYAGLAVVLNYSLQMTAFVALLSLDARRQSSGRLDILFCVVSKKSIYEALSNGGSPGFLSRIIENLYAPALLHKYVRPVVVTGFIAAFCASVVATTRLPIGLEQTTAMPEDSYLLPYFNNVSRYLRVGAPVYFVVDGEYPYDDPAFGGKMCSTGGNCSATSLATQLFRASQDPETSKIAQPPMAWIDSYYQWLAPPTGCCRYIPSKENNSMSPIKYCDPSDTNPNCTDCLGSGPNHPSKSEFDRYIHAFLKSNPSASCALGGHAAYGSALNFVPKSAGNGIKASYFMTYHTPANDSEGFTAALEAADNLAKSINKAINYPGVTVFPYSIFYVFYGQYRTIVKSAIINLSISTIALFAVAYVMLSLRYRQAFLILSTVWMIIVDVMGIMYLWDIKFNAISLVNLVVAMGIAVEFCVHIVCTFSNSENNDRLGRSREALTTTGSSVFSGITLTKFGGVVVLIFTKSRLFQVYYFRMYMAIVSVGAAHGLIFLPVLLSYIG